MEGSTAPQNGNTWNASHILIHKAMWLHDLPATNWTFCFCRMAPPTSWSYETKTIHDSTLTLSWWPSHRTIMDYHADRNCYSPSSHCLLQSAVWRHTHTPFRHSAGTWQAALLSQCTQSGSLYIIHSHYKTQSYFPTNAGPDWGVGHGSSNDISSSQTKWDEISLGYN